MVFKKPFENVMNPKIMNDVEKTSKKVINDEYRIYPITQAYLKDEGMEYIDKENLSDKNVLERLPFGKYEG